MNFYKVCEKILQRRLIEKSSLGLILSIRHEIKPKCFFLILLRHSKVTISLISYLRTNSFVKYLTFRVQECGDFFNVCEIWFVHPSRKKRGMKKRQSLNLIIYISGLANKFFWQIDLAVEMHCQFKDKIVNIFITFRRMFSSF